MDVYDCDRRIRCCRESILSRPDLLDSHRRAILRFNRHLQAEGLSKARRLKYLQTLPQVAKMLGKPFEDATREDIKRVKAMLDEKGISEDTKHSYRAIIKKFFR